MMRLLLVITFVLSAPLFVSAQATEDFTIRVFGAIDAEAPSTTTIQSITPITFSQIDLAWATSTDNFNVFGYVVFRDGIAIATTTTTFFSDVGLIASTTYSYTVLAFDGVPNYSSSSLPAVATTPGVPVNPTTSSSEGTAARVVLESFSVEPSSTVADFNISTRMPSRIEIRIGETSSYEIGYLAGVRYSRNHTVGVNDLRPNVTYFYEVFGYTQVGRQTVLRQGTFTTLSDTPPPAPVNVQAFTAQKDGDSVTLDWTIPEEIPEAATIRIVRSHYGYPSFINDGVVVYQGNGERALDLKVLNQYDRVYYTAFVVDPNGGISSGAITHFFLSNSVPVNQTEGGSQIDPPSLGTGPNDEGSTNSSSTQEIISLNMPQGSDISISQLDQMFTMASDTIPLAGDSLFTVSVPSSVIEGEFKTIIATLSDPRGSGKTFSFLLRLNTDRTRYEATIAGVQVGGVSEFMVEIYDYDSLVVGRYVTEIVFTAGSDSASSTTQLLWWQLKTVAWYFALMVPFIVLLILWFVYRRSEEEAAL